MCIFFFCSLECWQDNPNDRPDAQQVFAELKLVLDTNEMKLCRNFSNRKKIVTKSNIYSRPSNQDLVTIWFHVVTSKSRNS